MIFDVDIAVEAVRKTNWEININQQSVNTQLFYYYYRCWLAGWLAGAAEEEKKGEMKSHRLNQDFLFLYANKFMIICLHTSALFIQKQVNAVEDDDDDDDGNDE